MKKERGIIGHKIFVDLPSAGVNHVLAKVDTGADLSSIWASNIVEKNGQLFFELFDISSPYYTGKTIATRDFSEISVKNSFGHSEQRYKVLLQTRIGTRMVKVSYTLANRSKNSSPILIGRKTLNGKFVVDVTKKAEQRTQKVLVVSKVRSKEVAGFVTKIDGTLENAEIESATYDDIMFNFRNNRMNALVTTTGMDLGEYDMVHFRTSLERDITASLARYAVSRGVFVPDAETITEFPTMSKLYEYTILTLNKVSIPNSIFITAKNPQFSYRFFADELGVPFVLKDIHGSKGNFNEVVTTEADFRAILRRLRSRSTYLIAQKFTPNDGDYRVLVMGNRIELVIYRQRKDDTTHLNNTTQGGRATLLPTNELPPKVRRASLAAAKLMGRDIAGVDMVQDKTTNQWYCFEVNDGPQIVTGVFLDEKRVAYTSYIKRMLEKRI